MGVSDEELSVAAELLVNVTQFLTAFQEDGGMLFINEVSEQ